VWCSNTNTLRSHSSANRRRASALYVRAVLIGPSLLPNDERRSSPNDEAMSYALPPFVRRRARHRGLRRPRRGGCLLWIARTGSSYGFPANSVEGEPIARDVGAEHAGLRCPSRRITIIFAPADTRARLNSFRPSEALGRLFEVACCPPEADGTMSSSSWRFGALRVAPAGAWCTFDRTPTRDIDRAAELRLVLPSAMSPRSALVRSLRLAAPTSLGELVEWLQDVILPEPRNSPKLLRIRGDARSLRRGGTGAAKRALAIAAAGSHGILFGRAAMSGKNMLRATIADDSPRSPSPEGNRSHGGAFGGGCARPRGRRRHATPLSCAASFDSTAGLVGGGSSRGRVR